MTMFQPTDEQLEGLFEHIGEHITPQGGCNHTLRHARAWAEANAVDPLELIAWLNSEGAYCDCEVMMNVMVPRMENDQ